MRYDRFLAAVTAAMLLVVYSGCGGEEKIAPSSTSSGGATESKTGDKAGEKTAGGPAAAFNKEAIDVSLVMPDDFAALVIHPRRIAESSLVAGQLKDAAIADAIKKFGIDPSEVEQIVVLYHIEPIGMPEPVPVMIAHFTHDVDAKEILTKLRTADEEGPQEPINEIQVAGKTCFEIGKGNQAIAYAPNKSTIIMTFSPRSATAWMEQVFAVTEPKGPLLERLTTADANQDIIFALATDAFPDFDKLVDADKRGAPVDLEPLKRLQCGTVTFSLTAPSMLRAVLDGKDADAAGKLEELLQQALRMAGGGLAATKQSMPKEGQAAIGPLLKLADEFLDGAKVTKSGSQVVLDAKRPEILDSDGPAIVSTVRHSILEARAAGFRAVQLNNMRQIGMAMNFYAENQGYFPPAAIEKDGKPLLSWRVAILPYLGEKALYEHFHLDEPWDSPNNLEVAKKMPSVFRSRESPSEAKTRVMLFTGKGAAFDGGKKVSGELRRGAGNTILCVEAGADKAVPWTKPEDLPFDAEKPSAALGEVSPKGIIATFFDGSVRSLKVDDKTLKELIMPDDKPADSGKLNGGG